MKRRFVNDCGGKYKVALEDENGRTLARLLWGDHVRVYESAGGRARVKARGQEGWVPESVLTTAGLLEIYVIDVGQGDGVLMRTPDDKWHLIDAGVSNAKQMTKKGAANFVRWKFLDDLGRDGVELENVIVTHPDFDHYGGLLDLFSGRVLRPERTFAVSVRNFLHCGIGRFASGAKLGKTRAGSVGELPNDGYGVSRDGKFITELLDDKASFAQPARALESTFAELAAGVAALPTRARRLSHLDRFLPGYEGADGGTRIRVLGPIAESLQTGQLGLRWLGNESVTRNGHSIVLRVDHGQARVLLTGDLNEASQRLLLSHHDSAEFNADVAKGCHHGSDDIDLRFVRATMARATVVSSGDNEDYAHPRPRVLGASARYGREAKGAKGELLPPLIYSTELARSVRLSDAAAVRERVQGSATIRADGAEIKAVGAKERFERLAWVPIATDLVYGLINVRTDGAHVLCAYMKEGGSDFDVQVFRAGVEP